MEMGRLVAQLGCAMLGVDDFHALLHEATEEIASSAQAGFVSIQMVAGGARWDYRFDPQQRVPLDFSPRLPLRLASSAGRRSHLVIAEGANARTFGEAGLRFAILIPVAISRDEALELCIGFADPGRALSPTEIEQMEALATMLAIGASRHGFKQMAIFDATTHLYNRRWLDSHLPAEIERARRYHQPLAVLALDVDHFKKINDFHGHPVGDQVLLSISEVLIATIRSCDYAVRVGGDEFLVIFPATGAVGALGISRRVLEGVRALRFGQAALNVSVSGGVALADGESSQESLLASADAALYRAKRDGRDGIYVPEGAAPVFTEQRADRRRRQA